MIAVGLVTLGSGSTTLLALAMAVVAVAGFLSVLALPETRGVDLAPIVDPDQMHGTTPPPAAAAAPQNRPIATT